MGNKYKAPAPPKRRLLAKFKGRCYYCRREVSTKPEDKGTARFATRDHRIPRSKGGGGGRNIVLCCHECNAKKGCMMPGEFWQRQYDVDYEGMFRRDVLAETAMEFCNKCLGWSAARYDDTHIVNESPLHGILLFTNQRDVSKAVFGWCDASGLIMNVLYEKGEYRARAQRTENDNRDFQHADNMAEALLMACVESKL